MSKTVFTNGCFDLLHVGHLVSLDYARSLAGMDGKVFVGLNSDECIRFLKGPKRPIIPEDQRKKMLLALKSVDEVYIFDDPTPIELIKKLKPDIIVKGGDYSLQSGIIGNEIAEVHVSPYVDNVSTSYIIGKILGREKRNW